MSVTTPEIYQDLIEKGSAHPDLKAPLAEAIAVVDNPDSNRLWLLDDNDGARRAETVLAWEKENNKYLPAELIWGNPDFFFHYDGSIWYYKPVLEKNLDEDRRNKEADAVDPLYQAWLAEIRAIVPTYSIPDTPTLDTIREMIKLQPNGMPNFTKETEFFFQFDDVGLDKITAENIDLLTLTAIDNTFTSDYTPKGFEPGDNFYKKDGKIFWTNLLRWKLITIPLLRPPGIVLVSDDSYNYYISGWPTSIPADMQQIIITECTFYAKEYNKPFKIKNI